MRITLTVLTTLWASIVSSAALAGAPDAAAPHRPRLAVAEALAVPERLDDVRAKLREALEGQVGKHDMELVRAERPSGCATTECLAELARAAGASHVLVVTGAKNDMRGYRLEVSVWRARDGHAERSRGECNFCAAFQMVSVAEGLAGPLLDALQTSANEPPVAPPASAPAPTPPVVTAPAPARQPGRSTGRLALGAGLLAAGVAAGVTGLVLWKLDGDPRNCDSVCRRVYDTEGQGIILTIAGATAAGVGGYIAWNAWSTPKVTVGIGPSGLSLAGRF